MHHRTEDGPSANAKHHRRVQPESLVIRVKRELNSTNVIDAIYDIFIFRGVPAYIRSNNSPEFILSCQAMDQGRRRKDRRYRAGSPWENCY